MTYEDLRIQIPPISRISTLGGRSEVQLHNPQYGDLIAINSKGNSYAVSRQDWVNVQAIREQNPGNPWKGSLYAETSRFFSFGLIHAAALQRYIEQDHPVGKSGSSHRSGHGVIAA